MSDGANRRTPALKGGEYVSKREEKRFLRAVYKDIEENPELVLALSRI